MDQTGPSTEGTDLPLSVPAENNTSQLAQSQGNILPVEMTLPQVNGAPQAQQIPGSMPANTVFSNGPQSITADEIALYDRQIRLWGVQAQEKLRSAHILLVGIKAVASEVAKNLVLAGVGSLTIVDHEAVTEDDLGAQYFVSEEHIGQNRAHAALTELQKLNPRVNLVADQDMISLKPPEYFAAFEITIATNLDIDILSIINASCRISNRKFYAAATHGLYGYVFADLILHDFVIERAESNKVTEIGRAETLTRMVLASSTKTENGKNIEMVTKRESYSPIILANTSPLPADITGNRRRKLQVTPLISCFRALFDFQSQSGGRLPSHNRPDLELFTSLATERHRELLLPTETLRSEFLRSFLQNLGSEITPVAAFLGGSLAQDVINVLGQREQSLQNFLFFDGDDFKGPIYSLHPFFPDTLTMPTSNMVLNGTTVIDPTGAGVNLAEMGNDMGMGVAADGGLSVLDNGVGFMPPANS